MMLIGLVAVMSGFALLMTGQTCGGVAMLVPGVVFFIAGVAAARRAAPPGDTRGAGPAAEDGGGAGNPEAGTGRGR